MTPPHDIDAPADAADLATATTATEAAATEDAAMEGAVTEGAAREDAPTGDAPIEDAPIEGGAADASTTPSQRQAAVVEALYLPETYGLDAIDPERPIEQVVTHMSRIFLVGDRAYKLMRAVAYDFVDFTTLEARRRACETELQVNREWAPEIYLDARPVLRTDRGIRLGDRANAVDEAAAIDWLVEMRRFPRQETYDRRAADGRLERKDVLMLTDRIGRVHKRSPVLYRPNADAVRATYEGVAGTLSRQGDEVARLGADWAARVEQAHAALATRLDARGRHGFVRRVHGDLHLGNICCWHGRPTPFDAIAFNNAFAEIDVLYDLAFTLMDLGHRGLGGLAPQFLSRYLSETRDYTGLPTVPLYISLRAAIRAMVSALTGDRGEADTYLRDAIGALAAKRTPRLIAIGGLPGAGKSTLTRALATHLAPFPGAIILRADVARKRLFNICPETTAPPEAYAPDVSRRLFDRIGRDARKVLREGWPLLLDATWRSPGERAMLDEIAERSGAPFTKLWLTAPPDLLRSRIARREDDASDATIEVLDRQILETLAPEDWTWIDAGGAPGATLSQALEAVEIGDRAARR